MEKKGDLKDIQILVVEDSKTQLIQLQESLQKRGAYVHIASNGKEGLDLALKIKPNIIITDIEMPIMDGYKLSMSLKKNPNTKQIPIILLTNLSDPMDVIKGIECGADNFLTKPCDDELLVTSICNSLENQKRRPPMNNEVSSLEVTYNGVRHQIKADQYQITDLLLSTYSSAIAKNKELEQSNRKLSSLHLELQSKNKELNRAIEEKNLFLGMAAHDLRNPLHAIQGYSEILLNKLSETTDKKVERMLTTIYNSSRFMLQLVNDLLDLSIIDMGKLNLKVSSENLTSLVEDNCLLNENIAEHKNISLTFDHDPEIPALLCDRNKIEQVLHNLINNAIKYSNPGSSVHVSLKKLAGEVLLSVQDNGVGISKEDQTKLFQTFNKSRGSGTAGEPSTGLGLAIVKKIIQKHDGRIWVESELGKGTTFYVTFPLPKKSFSVK